MRCSFDVTVVADVIVRDQVEVAFDEFLAKLRDVGASVESEGRHIRKSDYDFVPARDNA